MCGNDCLSPHGAPPLLWRRVASLGKAAAPRNPRRSQRTGGNVSMTWMRQSLGVRTLPSHKPEVLLVSFHLSGASAQHTTMRQAACATLMARFCRLLAPCVGSLSNLIPIPGDGRLQKTQWEFESVIQRDSKMMQTRHGLIRRMPRLPLQPVHAPGRLSARWLPEVAVERHERQAQVREREVGSWTECHTLLVKGRGGWVLRGREGGNRFGKRFALVLFYSCASVDS